MKFETNQKNNAATVKTMVEKLDASNASELKGELLVLNKNGVNHIALDLSKTKYCDSSGLSAILTGNRLCKDSGGRFVLCGLNDAVLKLIQIAQLDKVFTITKNHSEAEEVLKS